MQKKEKILADYLIGSGIIDIFKMFGMGYIARIIYKIFESNANGFTITLVLTNIIMKIGYIILFVIFFKKLTNVLDRGFRSMFLLWASVIIILPTAEMLILRIMVNSAFHTNMMSLEFDNAMAWGIEAIIIFVYALCILLMSYYFHKVQYGILAGALLVIFFIGWYQSMTNMNVNMLLYNSVKCISVIATGIIMRVSDFSIDTTM